MKTEIIHSRYNSRIYLIYFLISLFVIQILTHEISNIFNLAVSSTVILICTSYLIIFYKFTKRITVTKTSIKINNKLFRIDEIESVIYNTKSNMTFPTDRYKECMVISFNSGVSYEFVYSRYSNLPFIKQFIYQVWDLKTNFIPYRTSIPVKDVSGVFNSIKGHPLKNLKNVLNLIFSTIFIFLLVFDFKNSESLLPIIIILLGSLYRNSYYFEFNNEVIRIKNYFIFWEEKIYHLSNIREIVFEKNNSGFTQIRIILDDFFDNIFIVAGLNKQYFQDALNSLSNLKVSIRNDVKK